MRMYTTDQLKKAMWATMGITLLGAAVVAVDLYRVFNHEPYRWVDYSVMFVLPLLWAKRTYEWYYQRQQ